MRWTVLSDNRTNNDQLETEHGLSILLETEKHCILLDTGASDVTISMVEATFMMKNGYLSERDVVGSQRYMDADGDISVGTIINLKEVYFGGHTLENVRASVVRNQKAPLLLGQSVLGRLGKIEIDNQKQLLIIRN